MITIRYMIANYTSGDIAEPEILGLQYAMYVQKPGQWFPNSAGNGMTTDKKELCKYIMNKAKMSGALTMLTPWATVRTEAKILIDAYKKKKPSKNFIRIDCYYTARDDISFGSAASGNFEFQVFAGMFLDGFKVTQYSVLGTPVGATRHGTAEVYTLESDKIETY